MNAPHGQAIGARLAERLRRRNRLLQCTEVNVFYLLVLSAYTKDSDFGTMCLVGKDVQCQPTHGGRCIELLDNRDEGDVMGIGQFDQLCEVGE